MEAANQSHFDDPEEYDRLKAIASGVLKSGVRGGMSFITEDKIREGETLYRIGHSSKPMVVNMSSPWWMRAAAFAHIAGSAKGAGSDFGELYRMKCAVSYDFGEADIILQAEVTQTLRAFTGRGRPVEDVSKSRKGQTWLGATEIAQLFIPGLRDFEKGFPTQLCHASIKIVEKFKVTDFIRVQQRRTRRTGRLG